MVKLSKLNGLKKTGADEERREMITPTLREALTKQGEEEMVYIKYTKLETRMEKSMQPIPDAGCDFLTLCVICKPFMCQHLLLVTG